MFRIFLDTEDRTQSNYPKYIKDHLYNTNPTFDYGDFKQLEYYITETNVTYNNFIFVFTEAGTYVFADAQDLERWVIQICDYHFFKCLFCALWVLII